MHRRSFITCSSASTRVAARADAGVYCARGAGRRRLRLRGGASRSFCVLPHWHHTVIILSSHCHHTVITLSSHCHHTVITLSSHCHHTVITLTSRPTCGWRRTTRACSSAGSAGYFLVAVHTPSLSSDTPSYVARGVDRLLLSCRPYVIFILLSRHQNLARAVGRPRRAAGGARVRKRPGVILLV